MLITGSLECGGAERQISDMANYWSDRGVRVTLATWTGPEIADFYDTRPEVRRIHLDDKSTGRIRVNLRRVQKLRRLLAETRPDAVLSFLTRSNVPTILAAVGLGLRVLVSERTQPAREIGLPLPWKLLRRIAYPLCNGVVCQTESTSAWVRRNWRIPSFVIPNALRALPEAGSAREPLVLAVGSLKPEKGFDLLLQAFATIAREFPEWRLTILGEGSQREHLERMRDQLGLAGRVEMPGRIQDVEGWMTRAGVVAQPSHFEGFPNAVLESMGMGAAVVSSDCEAGPAEMIKDGVNGRLVPVGDVAALAQALAELLSDPAERERLGREASKVRERYSQQRVMGQWQALLVPE